MAGAAWAVAGAGVIKARPGFSRCEEHIVSFMVGRSGVEFSDGKIVGEPQRDQQCRRVTHDIELVPTKQNAIPTRQHCAIEGDLDDCFGSNIEAKELAGVGLHRDEI